MTKTQFTIVPAQLNHAAEIAAIYAHHVLHGTASFETETPDAAEMAVRMAKILNAGAPWLVAQASDGTLLGYAYASQFRDRPAYRYACENSIYIRNDGVTGSNPVSGTTTFTKKIIKISRKARPQRKANLCFWRHFQLRIASGPRWAQLNGA